VGRGTTLKKRKKKKKLTIAQTVGRPGRGTEDTEVPKENVVAGSPKKRRPVPGLELVFVRTRPLGGAGINRWGVRNNGILRVNKKKNDVAAATRKTVCGHN